MIRSVQAKNFNAVPYLEGSDLMRTHPEVQFSSEKPNVIYGANGAGKSALLKALAYHTLSYLTGVSSFDDHYVGGFNDFWTQAHKWRDEYSFLDGLNVNCDHSPAFYYRPGAIPGDESSIASSMICGYFAEAREYGNKTDKKSSGQKCHVLMENINAILDGAGELPKRGYVNWSWGKELKQQDQYQNVKAEFLKKRHANDGATPVMLLDEPEQSLDARAEALLWKKIANTDVSRVQIIAATHSLYPLMHPEKFNLIEATPGYMQEVCDAAGLVTG
jgi:energy-coupling factor transporter ATP-binding protein EcfA2